MLNTLPSSHLVCEVRLGQSDSTGGASAMPAARARTGAQADGLQGRGSFFI